MFALISIAFFVDVHALVSGPPTCFVGDITVLGSPATFLHNLLTCASHVGGESGSVTDCLMGYYPAYGNVSVDCLNCTTGVMMSDTAINCLPNCIEQQTSSACVSCTPALVSAWTNTCDRKEQPPNGDPGSVVNADAVCSAADAAIVQSGAHFVAGSLDCLRNVSNLQSCVYNLVPEYNDISNGCKNCAASLQVIGKSASTINSQQCGAVCMQASENSSQCSECASLLSSAFNHQCLITESNGSLTVKSVLQIILTILVANLIV